MIGRPERRRSGLARFNALSVGFLAILLAGAVTHEANRERFRLKSAADLQELRDSLRRYDLRLTDVEQRNVRALDETLNALPHADREEALDVLRRYHNWLRQLPERDRNDVLQRQGAERLKRIQELVVKSPPPRVAADSPLDFIQIGGTSAFELASLCKVWLSLSSADRIRIDGLPVGQRKDALVDKGKELKVPRELRPKDYDESHWIEEAETRIRELRAQSNDPRDWLNKIEAKFEQATVNDPEDGPRARRFTKRLAVNLYVQEHDLDHSVDSTRLSAFYAAVPSWIQSTFSAFPADEVRRRLSVVYRIIYPHPDEYRPSAASQSKAAPPPPSNSPLPKPATAPRPEPTPPAAPF